MANDDVVQVSSVVIASLHEWYKEKAFYAEKLPSEIRQSKTNYSYLNRNSYSYKHQG